MLSKLILSGPLLLLVALPQTNDTKRPMETAPPPSVLNAPSTPPVKMGLWESTISGQHGTYKSRSCFTKESYQKSMASTPRDCTISNQSWTSHNFTADIACTMQGASSKGHIDVEFPDAETLHTTMSMTMTMQGHTTPVSFSTDAHFVSSDCGDIAPGQSRILH